MNVLAIWKVKAESTNKFCEEMRNKGIRKDSPATLMNLFAGHNFFYETDESFGDVTEESALRIAKSCNLSIKEF